MGLTLRGENLTGKTFNYWTVLEFAPRAGNNSYWKCKCVCGTVRDVKGTALRNNETKSCGCLRTYNLIGQRFGKLEVIRPTTERIQGCTVWECKCDCGTITGIQTRCLMRGTAVSCNKGKCYHSINDLTNQRFGKLMVVGYTDERRNGKVVWKCKCDCSNECLVPSDYLTIGDTNSCGCIKSIGEQKIQNILQDNNINYIPQIKFQDLRSPKGGLFRYDFGIYDKNDNLVYIIEYDGIIHFEYSGQGWNNQNKFEKMQFHDEIKNQYCIDNNISLIRIPYWELNNLNIDMLKLETTQFLYKGGN